MEREVNLTAYSPEELGGTNHAQHRHKRVRPLFVGAGNRRLGKPLPKSGGTIRARAAQGRSTRNAAVARP